MLDSANFPRGKGELRIAQSETILNIEPRLNIASSIINASAFSNSSTVLFLLGCTFCSLFEISKNLKLPSGNISCHKHPNHSFQIVEFLALDSI